MSGYGSLGGSGPGNSLVDRVQDAIFALTSSMPCTRLGDLCNTLVGAAGGGAHGGREGGSASAAASSNIKLNGRNVQIVKLLGEGGFSFVYLARDRESRREFALKKIRCPVGSDALPLALAEMESHRRFKSPYIMPLLDSAVIQETDGKTVYLFLPYYPMGNVQDQVNKNVVLGRRWAEREMLQVFKGACQAVREMHRYKLPQVGASRGGRRVGGGGGDTAGPSMSTGLEGEGQGVESNDQAPLIGGEAHTGGDGDGVLFDHGDEEDEEDDDNEHDEGGSSYPPKPKRNPFEDRQPRPSGDDLQGAKGGETVPYAHRDIKPANIMVSQASTDSGDATLHPVLMDFGSACRARLHIRSRREAIAEQDVAAERSSMPYRAPELFDIKTDTHLSEAVDLWSLGCTLFCMMYSHSPFETPQIVEQGGSVAMAVMNGSWKFPDQRADGGGVYSEATKEIVRRCLVLKPEDRADIEEVLELTDKAIRAVS